MAGILAIGDLVVAAMSTTASDPFGLAVSVVMIVLAVITLVLVTFGWSGRRGPAVGVAAIRVVASLAALPALFVPGIPTSIVLTAAGGIVLAIGAAVLVLVGVGRRSAHLAHPTAP